MNSAVLQKMKDKGLFTEEDVADAATQSAEQAVTQAAPVIAQQTVSPDNIQKKVGLYKQGIASSIMSPVQAGAQ